MMVPHAIVTVSLTTAILPRLSDFAADKRARRAGPHGLLDAAHRAGRRPALRRTHADPARDVAGVLFDVGAGDPGDVRADADALRSGPGLLHRPLPDAARVLCPRADPPRLLDPVRDLRHQHRAGRRAGRPRHARPTAPALVLAWGASYVVGSALSYTALRRTVGGLSTPRLLRFFVRMAIVCAVAAAAAFAVEWALDGLGEEPGMFLSLLRGGLAGSVGVAVVLLLARAFRLREVTSVTDVALSRVCGGVECLAWWRPACPESERRGGVACLTHSMPATARPPLPARRAAGRERRWSLLARPRPGARPAVAVHVIARSDSRAAGLLDAARRTAPHHDRRLLRVLDADQTDELTYVVNEWGSGTSLDIMLAGVRTAAAAAGGLDRLRGGRQPGAGHEAGLDHGRMVPENVLIDRQGEVRDHRVRRRRRAARAAPRAAVGRSRRHRRRPLCRADRQVGRRLVSLLPRAPMLHGEVLRPRRVRAGIPRPLDALCDQVINPASGHTQRSLTTCRPWPAWPRHSPSSSATRRGWPRGRLDRAHRTDGPPPTQPIRRIESMPAPAPSSPSPVPSAQVDPSQSAGSTRHRRRPGTPRAGCNPSDRTRRAADPGGHPGLRRERRRRLDPDPQRRSGAAAAVRGQAGQAAVRARAARG